MQSISSDTYNYSNSPTLHYDMPNVKIKLIVYNFLNSTTSQCPTITHNSSHSPQYKGAYQTPDAHHHPSDGQTVHHFFIESFRNPLVSYFGAQVFLVSFFCAEVLSMSPKRRFLFENRRTTRRQRSPPPPRFKI